jgi:alcohol dehydrogenase class IV
MKLLNTIYNKSYLFALSLVSKFVSQPNQITFAGSGSLEQLCAHITRMGLTKVLLVTDKPLVDLGIAQRVVDSIEASGGGVAIYDGVLPDPTTAMVDAGVRQFNDNNCDAVLALGGGSSIDTAKGVAAAVTNGAIASLVGVMKVKNKVAPLFAIATTSGTGSEVSVAAVISDAQTHAKGLMIDVGLVPSAIALDPSVMLGMPKFVTAATGMDALTHAIETYVSTWANADVKNYSGTAVKLIYKNLPIVFEHGEDINAREAMALGSYYAGLSLNISGVGNVHAIAHQLGGKYGIAHGLANAVVLPHVLERSHAFMAKGLAELAELIGVGEDSDSDSVRSLKFIDEVKALNQLLGMPEGFEKIQNQDMAGLAKDAVNEGRTYPVPELYDDNDVIEILKKITLKPSL